MTDSKVAIQAQFNSASYPQWTERGEL